MSLLDEAASVIGSAESSEGGQGINYGNYTFLIEQIVVRKGTKGLCFIPEFYVAKSSPGLDEKGQTSTPNAEGSSVGYVCNLTKKPAQANARAFILAILGQSENKTAEQNALVTQKMKEWSGDAGSASATKLRGVAVTATTWAHTIASGPNTGKAFPRVKFTLVPGQTKDSIAANRAMLDNGKTAKVQAEVRAVAATPAPAPATAGPDPLGGMF